MDSQQMALLVEAAQSLNSEIDRLYDTIWQLIQQAHWQNSPAVLEEIAEYQRRLKTLQHCEGNVVLTISEDGMHHFVTQMQAILGQKWDVPESNHAD